MSWPCGTLHACATKRLGCNNLPLVSASQGRMQTPQSLTTRNVGGAIKSRARSVPRSGGQQLQPQSNTACSAAMVDERLTVQQNWGVFQHSSAGLAAHAAHTMAGSARRAYQGASSKALIIQSILSQTTCAVCTDRAHTVGNCCNWCVRDIHSWLHLPQFHMQYKARVVEVQTHKQAAQHGCTAANDRMSAPAEHAWCKSCAASEGTGAYIIARV